MLSRHLKYVKEHNLRMGVSQQWGIKSISC